MPAPERTFHVESGDGVLTQDGPFAEDKAAKELSSQVNHISSPSKRGSSGINGGLYQINLLTIVMLNALGKIKGWQLSSENPLMGKFDDIIVESPEECILIQAKQKDKKSKKITYESLFATASKAPVSLIRYFLSFQEMKNKLNIKNAIICTTMGIKIENNVKNKNKVISWRIINEHNASTEHILYSKKVNNIYYTFKEDFLKELKKQILEYLEINKISRNKDVEDDDIRYFLSKLQIFPNFLPDQECLEAVGKEAISHIRLAKNLNAKSAFKYINKKVGDWYKEEKFSYIVPDKANAYFCEIISRNFCDSLKEYNVAWECKDLHSIFHESNIRVFHIAPQNTCMLNVTKVFQALKNNPSKVKFLFLNQKESIEVQRDIIQVFSRIPLYVFLVIVFPLHADYELLELLSTVITNSNYKKIIVIAEPDNELADKISSRTDNFLKYTDNIMFENLSIGTRENFLKQAVMFQGVPMSLEKVMANETGNIPGLPEINYIVDSEMLEKLAKKDEIVVWDKVEHLDENIKHYYINRKFIRDKQHYSEEQLCQRGEKVVLISAMPGMGKSTVLSSLAIAMKKDYPYLWVIRVDLNNYSSILKTCSKRKPQQIPLTELLESQEVTELKNEFQRRLFKVKKKVVLMIDAVDEISPNYFDIVIHLLENCWKDQNINRIFITTRPHVCQDLERKLGVIAYKLEPYSQIDQLCFLADYWIKHLDLQEQMLIRRCWQYANFLIDELSKRIHNRSDSLFGNPLHIRMLAEVFQQKNKETSDQLQTWDGCREFLSSEKKKMSLPEDFTLIKLFTDFIYKKHNILVEDKGNTRGNVLMENTLTEAFNKSHEFHYILAMQVILPPDEEELSVLYRSKQEVSCVRDYSLKLGIVQQMHGALKFIHRTFAEYYVAKGLLIELKQENQNEQLTNFFLTEILSEQKYYSIRALLDDFLSEELSSYSEVTQNLTTYVLDKLGPIAYIKSQKYLSSPIHIAAKEGRLHLIKLLMGQLVESTSLRAGQVVQLNAADWLIARDCNDNIALHCAVKNGHLHVVKFLMEQYADINVINLKDSKGLTVLHCAVRRGDMEVIKFLIDKLVHVKWFEIRDSNGLTVLHYAAMGGFLHFVEFILKQYGDSSWIDVKNDEGLTELTSYTMRCVPLSAHRDNSHIVIFLVEQLATNWINIRDSKGATMLHYAAMGGNLPVVKFLMKQLANNWIDNRDHEGRTILHYAAMGFNKLNSEFSSNFQVVSFLMEQLGDINWITIRDDEGLTALHYATMASNLQVVEFLIKQLMYNNWIYLKDNNGRTVLHYAAMGCKVPFAEDTTNLQLVIFLMQQLSGTKWIDIRDNRGLTVLHYATKTGDLEVVDFLMSQLGDDWLGIKDNDGLTVLHYAAKRDSVIVIEFIMRRFLHVHTEWINIRDGVGSTALHVAAQECKLRVVNSLLRCLEMMDLNSLKSIKPLIIEDIYGIPHKFDFRNLDTVALSCVIKDIKIIIENRDRSFDSEGSGTTTCTMYSVDDDENYYYRFDASEWN